MKFGRMNDPERLIYAAAFAATATRLAAEHAEIGTAELSRLAAAGASAVVNMFRIALFHVAPEAPERELLDDMNAGGGS